MNALFLSGNATDGLAFRHLDTGTRTPFGDRLHFVIAGSSQSEATEDQKTQISNRNGIKIR